MKPLIHVSVSKEIDGEEIERISTALSSLEQDYDLVVTSDLVSLYLQDPETLRRIEERLEFIQVELENIKNMLPRLYVAG